MPGTKPTAERRIRAHGLRLWRADGAPAGREAEYQERARELQAFVDNPGAGLLANPMTQHGGAIPPTEPVEEAAIEENLGEFPSRLTDQGDRPAAPMTRNKARRYLRDT